MKTPKTPLTIPTRMRIILPSGQENVRTVDLPTRPGFRTLNELVIPILREGNGTSGSCEMEHLGVYADFEHRKGPPKFRVLDMFVDDRGRSKGLPRNEVATAHYRRANQMGKTNIPKVENVEDLNFIVGTAVLFDRRVWY